jgi:hypothetical protein
VFDVDDVGLVGSPSTTTRITVDILEDATGKALHGQLVYLAHPLADRFLIALGTVTEILTSNRWHEDPNMRGVLKRYGRLPHLSAVGDVRTAEVLVQAAYLADSEDLSQGEAPIESGGSLSMSPTTGASVARVTDEFLGQLLRRHQEEIVYLGHIYQNEQVRLPLIIRDFRRAEEGGAGEAYHTGVFGMTGSGKSGFAAYLISAQLRHPHLAVLIMDPQGQFTSERGLPFSLQEWAEQQGRDVLTYSISQDIRLQQDATLLSELLTQTRFFRDVLTLRSSENRESAVQEFGRVLRGLTRWDERPPDDVLRDAFTALVNDAQALQRIYASQAARGRLHGVLTTLVSDVNEFEIAADIFRPLHSLFTTTNAAGRPRVPLYTLLGDVLNPDAENRPLIIIDFSSHIAGHQLLNSTSVKARILRRVCSMLNLRAEQLFREDRSLNTLVVFDEAQRFAAEAPDSDEAKELAERLVDYVRTTRKYGLGWTFITQEVSSLRRGIYDQLRVRCFGYGLTSGTELTRLSQTVGDRAARDLYASFVDPEAIRPSKYPFMLTGPVSPLSFTGAPVFLSVYTDFDNFLTDNGLAGGNG